MADLHCCSSLQSQLCRSLLQAALQILTCAAQLFTTSPSIAGYNMRQTWQSPVSQAWTPAFKAALILSVLTRCTASITEGEGPFQHRNASALRRRHISLSTRVTWYCRHRSCRVQQQHHQLCSCQHSVCFHGMGQWH